MNVSDSNEAMDSTMKSLLTHLPLKNLHILDILDLTDPSSLLY